MTANMKFVDRPVTQHGMTGISMKAQGEGRVVYDRSFFMGVLRHKSQDIYAEIEKFKKNIDEM